MSHLQPYRGSKPKLVIAMDIGTTYSGVSYTLLEPGVIPEIHDVTRYPGQLDMYQLKIPSILYYSPEGMVHSIGAEATRPGIELEVEDAGLFLVKWFKLHLRPDTQVFREYNPDANRLPEGKNILEVFSDFIDYLFRCTREFIRTAHPNGTTLWESIEDHIEFVLAHPNGWEGQQQSQMRRAAIRAGLVPDTPDGRARIQFVTEGEAGLHYCIANGIAAGPMLEGVGVMVIDAGGGTVDISSYSPESSASPSTGWKEIAPAACIIQGSTQVNDRAETFLTSLLKNSKYGNDEDIKAMMDDFDKSTKPAFTDPSHRSFIKFGSMKDNEPSKNIRRGQLTLSGSDVESFFKPSLDEIVASVQDQQRAALEPISTVFLIGGFAASGWLYTRLRDALQPLGLNLCRPDVSPNKAVAQGSMRFYLEHHVTARVMKKTYGTDYSPLFRPGDPQHIAHISQIKMLPSGLMCIRGAFETILTKGTRLRVKEEISKKYTRHSRDERMLTELSERIICYDGEKSDATLWMADEPEHFTTLCTVSANMRQVTKIRRVGRDGVYHAQNFEILLICGSTELQAQIRWMENSATKGEERRSPAEVIYDAF
ncbi:hypothetical protein C8Q79DRAFT_182232 [Trametes meyenii]|nr:hypothetical protein C8Q79DRAFT_182232 [Trametes meyenii]